MQQLIIIANFVLSINLALKYLGASWRSFLITVKSSGYEHNLWFLAEKDNRDWITVQFEWNAAWNNKMRQVAGAKWSNTLKCWLVADTRQTGKTYTNFHAVVHKAGINKKAKFPQPAA